MLLSTTDLDSQKDDYATNVVDRVLQTAVEAGASDVHITQTRQNITIRWRVQGNLVDVADIPDGKTTQVLSRLKALARLITYRSDIPQEGRLVLPDRSIEARVGTLPTLHGERAVVRLSSAQSEAWLPSQLGLSAPILSRLESTLAQPSGVILVTGTAGSGKTTSVYACLRQLVNDSKPRSIVTLEDPVELELTNVAQSQIEPSSDYDWKAGLKALLRQDPEVMLVGEIRDPETASVVFQAALTGQLVLSTMHARSAADAIRRLLDMGVPAYHLRSGLDLLICQKLILGVCPCVASQQSLESGSCSSCSGTGLGKRQLFAEVLPPIESTLAKTIAQDADTSAIQFAADSLGMIGLKAQVEEAVASGKIPLSELSSAWFKSC